MTLFSKTKLHLFAHIITWARPFFAFSPAAYGRVFLDFFARQTGHSLRGFSVSADAAAQTHVLPYVRAI